MGTIMKREKKDGPQSYTAIIMTCPPETPSPTLDPYELTSDRRTSNAIASFPRAVGSNVWHS